MTVELRHGYTLSDVHQMTAAALKADRSLVMDYRDRHDIAWSAIVEALYAAPHWPRRSQLIQAGWQAIYDEVRDSRRHKGYRDREWDAGLATAPRFAAYWLGSTVVHSHEDRVVERTALPPILAALTPGQRSTLVVVAAHDGDREAAAQALGVSRKAVDFQLLLARRRCLALWLEHETPVQVSLRRPDRRRHRGDVAPCGTVSAVHRHRSRKERLCELCVPVGREYERARAQARKDRTARQEEVVRG